MARWEYDPDWSDSYTRQQERAWEHGFDSYSERYEARSEYRDYVENHGWDYDSTLVDRLAEFDHDFTSGAEGGDWTRDDILEWWDALMDEYDIDWDMDDFYDYLDSLYED